MVWKKYQESENKEEVGENLFIFLKESEKKKKWGKKVILGEWKPEKVEEKIKRIAALTNVNNNQLCIVHFVWKVSLFGVILVRIFPQLDWIRRDTPYLSAFSSNTGKCKPE